LYFKLPPTIFIAVYKIQVLDVDFYCLILGM
jgi:hypothetical protein